MSRPIVTLSTGRYIGQRNGRGTMTFMGIPYGTFQGRWKPLSDVPAGDVLTDAGQIGPACPQVPFGPYPSFYDQISFSETDCFTVSVSTADLQGKKPVLVYIHGGANIAGGYFDPKIRTEGFVDRHPDLVAVTFNYRLGTLGTLCLDQLTHDEAYRFSGNLSTLDQLQALKWVHRHIAAFGGDPDNVTIAGQSSGCASVKQLLFVRESWPLWRRAICQSGTTLSRSRPATLREARSATAQLCAQLGVGTLKELLAMDVQRLLSVFPLAIGVACVEDGLVLPFDMNRKLCGGEEGWLPADKAIFLGCMNGDMDGFAQDKTSLDKTVETSAGEIADMLRAMPRDVAALYAETFLPDAPVEEVIDFFRQFSPEDARALLAEYRVRCPEEDPFFLVSDCLNDFLMYNPLALESCGLAKDNRVWLYVWEWAPGSNYPMRATHAMEVPIVANAANPFPGELPVGEQSELERMYDISARIWGSFIRTGIPCPEALSFDGKTRPTLYIGLAPENRNDPRKISRECLLAVFRSRHP